MNGATFRMRWTCACPNRKLCGAYERFLIVSTLMAGAMRFHGLKSQEKDLLAFSEDAMRRLLLAAILLLGVGVWGSSPAAAQHVQNPYYPGYQLNNFFYYPYYYFPHNYWPAYTPKW